MATRTDRRHERAALVSIGDELAIGQTLDTNSAWLGARLTDLGLRVTSHRTVPDDLGAIERALLDGAREADAVVATGGLGPTADDLTRAALASAMGEALVEDERARATLEAFERARGREPTPERLAQALRPGSATLIDNPNGTAPGVAARLGGADAFCLPGPPRELRPMFEVAVAPALRPPGGRAVVTRVLRTFGLPESDAAARLGALMDRDASATVGTTASGGIITIRVRAEGERAEAERLVAGATERVRAALGDFEFGEGDATLGAALVASLRARDETLVVAESCTGGLLGGAITRVPGSSDVFAGGWITYANAMKAGQLGVDPAALDGPPGAVSREVAVAMAGGALERAAGAGSPADHALSITGVAGPGGGSEEKPVGTVWVCRASARAVGGGGGASPEFDARRFLVTGDRDDVRERSATVAMGMLWHALERGSAPRLVFQAEP